MTIYDELLKKKQGGSTPSKGVSTYDRLKDSQSEVPNRVLTTYDRVKASKIPAVPEPQKTFGDRISEFGAGVKNAIKSIPNVLGNVGNTVGKFAAKVDVAGAQLFADTVDYSADFLNNVIIDQIKGRDYRVLDPLQVLGKEKRSEIADKWKNFYKNNVGNQTEALKEVVNNLNKLPAMQPSKEWSEASLEDKFKPKHLPETILEIGPGVIASLGSYAINPVLGLVLSTGSTANDVNELAQKAGVPEEKALSLSLGTGLLVGFLDKIVPDGILNSTEKQVFNSAFAKKVAITGIKEAFTEVTQESAQVLVESTLREDLGFDEIKTRVVMAGFGGFLGGAGMKGVVGFANNVRSGDIAAINQEDIKNPEVLSELDQKLIVQPDTQKVAAISEKQLSDTTDVNKPQENQSILGRQDVEKRFNTPKETLADRINRGDASMKNLQIEGDNVRIYRGQSDGSSKEIKAGDFIAFNENTARNYSKDSKTVQSMLVPTDEILLPKGAAATEGFYAPKDSTYRDSQMKLQSEPKIQSSQPELDKINAEKVKNVTDVKSARTVLKDVQVQLDQAVTEAEGKATVAQSQREGINTDDVAKLKRVYATTKAFQEGDIETIRASKHADLVNRVIENIQETQPDMSEAEALDYALNLPTKAQESPRNSQIRDLETKQKTLSKYLDLLKSKQTELDLKEDEALSKEWERALATQEQLKKLVTVSPTQLPVGEGKQKVSRLQARMQGALNATPDQIEELGLQTYNQMNQEDQIVRAAEYVKNNPQDALRVITGEINPPKGILQNSVFKALTDVASTDLNIAKQVATLAGTRFGQEINILKTILADNPAVIMQDTVQARIEAYEQKTGRKISEIKKSDMQDIQSEIKKPNKADWRSFVESIQC